MVSVVVASNQPGPTLSTWYKVATSSSENFKIGQQTEPFHCCPLKVSSLCLSEKEAAYNIQGRRCEIRKALISVSSQSSSRWHSNSARTAGNREGSSYSLASDVTATSYETHFMNEAMGQASVTTGLA